MSSNNSNNSNKRFFPLSLLVLALGCAMVDEGTGADVTSATTTTSGDSASDTVPTEPTSSGATTAVTSGGASDSAGAGCGNGVIDDGELCDGDAVGGMTCVDLGAPYIGGSLGCGPACDAYDASGCDVDASAPLVRLNELFAKGVDAGPYAEFGDLIELYNAGGAVADLSGWRLSDEIDLPEEKTYVFPPGSTLAPGAWMVLRQYDDATEVGEFPFGISSSNEETIVLVDTADLVVDSVTFSGELAVISYCRVPDGGSEWMTCLQTPGEANVAADPEEEEEEEEEEEAICGDGNLDEGEQCDGDNLGGKTCVDVGAFNGGDLACTDACTFDTQACTTESIAPVINELTSSGDDLIELYNAGEAPIDLSGWVLTDDPSDPYDVDADTKKRVFADGVTLKAGEFMVSVKGDLEGQHPFGLGKGGDTVRLFNAKIELVDSVTYGESEAEVSYCRIPDGPGGAWMAGCLATFGEPNQAP